MEEREARKDAPIHGSSFHWSFTAKGRAEREAVVSQVRRRNPSSSTRYSQANQPPHFEELITERIG